MACFLLIILASQTFYPNWPIFLHGYIRHIRDIFQLWLSCPQLSFQLLLLSSKEFYKIGEKGESEYEYSWTYGSF